MIKRLGALCKRGQSLARHIAVENRGPSRSCSTQWTHSVIFGGYTLDPVETIHWILWDGYYWILPAG